jgi:hypothetical protein
MKEVIETGQEQERTEIPSGNPDTSVSALDSYLWQPPGKDVRVRIDLDVVDRLLQEVMRGFGAVPKRGVEVGGILLGYFDNDGSIRVSDFETVSCQHSRGAAYVLSDEELARFRSQRERWSSSDPLSLQAVGFFRSHTRDGLGLAREDLEMFAAHFPDPRSIVLLVKPYATRASTGAIFFRESEGIRTDSSHLEFPFRRKDLGGDSVGEGAPPSPAASEPLPPPHASPPPATNFSFGGYAGGAANPPSSTPPPSKPPSARPPKARGEDGPKSSKTGWVWIPLSFIFLLLGVVLGVQVALSISNKLPASLRPPDPYSMHLTASPSGDSVHVRWDRAAPAIQDAPRGVLHIQDGASEQRVDLDALQLQNGSVIYRRATTEVHFRLDVMTRERVTVSESTVFTVR